MSILRKIQFTETNGNTATGYAFWCPGCEHGHLVYTKHSQLRWQFNGDLQKPTFEPSIKNTYPDGRICHLFIRNGEIQYCKDSTHHLAGKTIKMKEGNENGNTNM